MELQGSQGWNPFLASYCLELQHQGCQAGAGRSWSLREWGKIQEDYPEYFCNSTLCKKSNWDSQVLRYKMHYFSCCIGMPRYVCRVVKKSFCMQHAFIHCSVLSLCDSDFEYFQVLLLFFNFYLQNDLSVCYCGESDGLLPGRVVWVMFASSWCFPAISGSRCL